MCMRKTKLKNYVNFSGKNDGVLQLDTNCCNQKYATKILYMRNVPY